ncbi:PRC-barrel domain-containing protein [Thioalkalivibrio sp. ALMg11]|uniref:PRC-barrel domain-containing protein n=1 Tax=Thioalkalivibrio sp. ALMg11 TaxID=1158165 RepID=UPI0003770F70|nr:PRC-barrel domain-containing protein [Thioalkalivibrio sp. ALMg11]
MIGAAAFSRIGENAPEDAHDGPTLLSAKTITGDEVCNMREEKLGDILDVMLDTSGGKIRYVVLTSGGFLGMGDRLFAIARTALKHDKEHKRFMLDVNLDRLRRAPGFTKDQRPNMADFTWHLSGDSYYARDHSEG